MSRHKFTECILNVQISGYVEVTDEANAAWHDRGDDVQWRRLRFESRPGLPCFDVTIYRLADGEIEVDAPNLFLVGVTDRDKYRTIVFSTTPSPQTGTLDAPI